MPKTIKSKSFHKDLNSFIYIFNRNEKFLKKEIQSMLKF